MADVDVRELVTSLLGAIHTEMVQDLQLMQAALQVELDEVSAPQLVRQWSCQSCNNELLARSVSWYQHVCCVAGQVVRAHNGVKTQANRG